MRIQTVHGAALAEFLPQLARVRIEVFREWPYLYDGSLEYEEEYLQRYVASPRSLGVLAWDGDRLAGASTALPLADEVEDFRRPFEALGLDPKDFFYFGESVLSRAWRGRGIGVRFFEEREGHARRLGGFSHTCFCAVERPPDHPARPAGYRPLDSFWERRGYRRREDLRTTFPWKDLGEAEETPKPMGFWVKPL